MSFNFFADEAAFREQTDRQSRMPCVTSPSFRCGECSLVCRTLGRKKTAAGWRCAGCHQAREQRRAGKGGACAQRMNDMFAHEVRDAYEMTAQQADLLEGVK